MKVKPKAIWPTGLVQSDTNWNQAFLIHLSYRTLSMQHEF